MIIPVKIRIQIVPQCHSGSEGRRMTQNYALRNSLITQIAIVFFTLFNYAYSQEQTQEPSFRPKVEYTADESKEIFQSCLTNITPLLKDTSTTMLQDIKPPSLTTQGIIWQTDLPQAIINNKVVKVGDVIEGAEVIKIDKSGVEISFRNKLFKLDSFSVQNHGSTEERKH